MLHLDAIRFFAAAAVVYYHWQWKFIPIPGLVFFSGHVSFTGLAVDLFFILSGVVMYRVYFGRINSGRDFANFMQKRVARLYPLHLLTLSLLQVSLLAAETLHIHLKFAQAFTFGPLIVNALLLQAFPVIQHGSFSIPAWSVSAEMGCYVLLPVLFVLCRRRWWTPAALGLAATVALSFWNHGSSWTFWSNDYGFLRALPTFLFGVALGGASHVLQRIPYPHLLFPFFGCGIFVLGFMGASRGILLPFVYLIAITGFACDVQRKEGWFVHAFAPLGQLTYSIYLLHLLFEGWIFSSLDRLHLSPWLQDGIVVAAFFPFLIFAYLSFVYFETPARRWVSSLGCKRTARVADAVSLNQ
jgi:peptidoglycan/LPS O-acetylase OafA/YrhL